MGCTWERVCKNLWRSMQVPRGIRGTNRKREFKGHARGTRAGVQCVCEPEGHRDHRGTAGAGGCVRGMWECERMNDRNHVQAECGRWAGDDLGPQEGTLGVSERVKT